MSDKVLIHDNADKVPAQPAGRHPHTPISGADFTSGPRRRLSPQAWLLASICTLLPLLWLLWRLDGALSDLALRYAGAGDVLLGLLVLASVATLLVSLCLLVARLWLGVQQARVIRSRLGVPVDVVQQLRADPQALEAQAITLELMKTPHSQHPYLSTLSQSSSQASPALPVLPEPPISDVPESQWRGWLKDAPHLLISGPTNAGKTTLARALLIDSADSTGQLLILDPHDSVGKWPVDAIGGGRNYQAIYAAVTSLLAEMDARFKQYQQGQTHFTTLTCLIDEGPAIALQDQKRWTKLVSCLTSEARKVNVKIIVLGQSHLVRDLGISSLVRRNLGLVSLGPQALDLINEERDLRRRAHLIDLLRGQQRSAAYAYRGEVHVLDVSNVPVLAQKPFTASAWVPSPVPDDGLTDAGDNGNGSPVPSGNQHDSSAEWLRENLVVGLKRGGRNREDIRQELREVGLGLKNTDYSAILAKHGLE